MKYDIDKINAEDENTMHFDVLIEEGEYNGFVVRIFDMDFSKLPEIAFDYTILKVPETHIDKEIEQNFVDNLGKIVVDFLEKVIKSAEKL